MNRMPMKKFIPLVLALTISGVCCVVAAYFCHYYYTLHENTVTGVESHLSSFDMRLATLEAHKSRELTPVHVWGLISTTDRPEDHHMLLHLSQEERRNSYFEAVGAKGGPLIRPELRVPAGSVTNCEYDIQMKDFGVVTAVWLSQAEPYQDLASFDFLHAYCPNKTNVVRLVARLKPGASVQMRFHLVLLCLQ